MTDQKQKPLIVPTFTYNTFGAQSLPAVSHMATGIDVELSESTEDPGLDRKTVEEELSRATGWVIQKFDPFFTNGPLEEKK